MQSCVVPEQSRPSLERCKDYSRRDYCASCRHGSEILAFDNRTMTISRLKAHLTSYPRERQTAIGTRASKRHALPFARPAFVDRCVFLLSCPTHGCSPQPCVFFLLPDEFRYVCEQPSASSGSPAINQAAMHAAGVTRIISLAALKSKARLLNRLPGTGSAPEQSFLRL